MPSALHWKAGRPDWNLVVRVRCRGRSVCCTAGTQTWNGCGWPGSMGKSQSSSHSSSQSPSCWDLLYFYWLLGYCWWPMVWSITWKTTDWLTKDTPSFGGYQQRSHAQPGRWQLSGRSLMKPARRKLLFTTPPRLPSLWPGSSVVPHVTAHPPICRLDTK